MYTNSYRAVFELLVGTGPPCSKRSMAHDMTICHDCSQLFTYCHEGDRQKGKCRYDTPFGHIVIHVTFEINIKSR